MPNIFQRIAKGIGDLLGIGVAPPPPPPPPPAPPREHEFPEEEPEEEEYFPPPEEEEQPAEEIDIPYHPPENDIIYIPRSGSVLGRWEVGPETSPPTLGDVEELLRVADEGRDGQPFYTYIVYGVLEVDSPRAAKVREVGDEPDYLGFVVPFNNAWYYFGGANTIEEYFNELLRLSTVVWKRIDTVQVLDKRKP